MVTGVNLILAISHATGIRIAEVAFLLFVIAGIWTAFGWAMPERLDRPFASRRFRMIVAGILIAAAGLLLIISTHFGHLFS
jgi:hypothetical protein